LTIRTRTRIKTRIVTGTSKRRRLIELLIDGIREHSKSIIADALIAR